MQQTKVLIGQSWGGGFQKMPSRDVAGDGAGQDQISETELSLPRHVKRVPVLG